MLVKDLEKWDDQAAPVNNEGAGSAAEHSTFKAFVKGASAHLKGCKGKEYVTANGHKAIVTLYMPDDVMEIGSVSIEQYSDDNPIYHVTSHHIKNRRFCPYNSPYEYRTVSSVNIDKALANARKYLKPNRLADVARISFEAAREEWSRVVNGARRLVSTAVQDLGMDYSPTQRGSGGMPELLSEAIRLTEMGLVKFSDGVGEKLGAFQEALARYESASADKESMLCWIHPDYKGDMVTDMHAFSITSTGSDPQDARLGRCPFNKNFMMQGQLSVPSNEVSEGVQHKVAALSICEDYEFVEDVGFKFNNSVYYVYAEE
jgi:hypothetical protein